MGKVLLDKSGRQWVLDLTIGCAMRIQDQTGLNLLADTVFTDMMVGGVPKPGGMAAALPQLEADPIQLARVLYAAVQEEVAVRNLNQDQFLAAWDGPSLRVAYGVLVAAICDFFPDRADRIRHMAAAIDQGRSKTVELTEGATAAAGKMLEQIDVAGILAAAMREAEGELRSIRGNTFGNSPGSLEPTPAPIASAS